ncbi:ribonuclease [Aromatoleum toluvorans]|uniref:Ribonuclease n=1 Tax=Aromatoleum toluvorans TaxID=92002 RepID=A0ABX1Q209_9RHOO|nr:ribonuclease [Aromatoleum toluvorans]
MASENHLRALVLRLALFAATALAALPGCGRGPDNATAANALPPEAVATLRLIDRGGPFPYRKDGTVFQNRERQLPDKPRGYYREYTVPTPGEDDRGARRIVTGGNPPEVYYYTGDHYRSFRRIESQR